MQMIEVEIIEMELLIEQLLGIVEQYFLETDKSLLLSLQCHLTLQYLAG